MKRSNNKKKVSTSTTTTTTNLATPKTSKNLSSILSSPNNKNNNKTKKDAQTVVTTKTSATLQSLYAKAKHQDVDQLFQDLLGNDDDDNKAKGDEEDKSGAGLGGGSSTMDNDSSTAMSSLLPIVTTPIISSSGPKERKKKGDVMEGGGLMSVEDEVMQILNDTSKTTAGTMTTTTTTGTLKDSETVKRREEDGKRRGSSDTLRLSNHKIDNDDDLDDLCASTAGASAAGNESKTKHSEASSMPWGDLDDDDDDVNDIMENMDSGKKQAAPISTVATTEIKENKPIGEIFVYGDNNNKNELKNRPTTSTVKASTTTNEPRHYRIAGSSSSISKKSTSGASTSSAFNRRPIRQRRTRANDNASLLSGDGESVGSHGVSSILKSMGLGPEFSSALDEQSEISEDGTQGKDKPPGPLSRHLASMMKKSSTATNNITSINTKNTTLEKMDRFLQRRQHRMLHLRAGMMILGLVGIMYFIVQFTAVVKHDKMAMQSLKGRSGGLHTRHNNKNHHSKNQQLQGSDSWNQHSGEHEEGVDRPLANLDVLRKRASGGNLRGTNERTPSEIALNLVKGKVPTKREGPVDDGPDSNSGGVRRKRAYDEIDNLETEENKRDIIAGDKLEDYNSEGAPLEKYPEKEQLLPAEAELSNLMEETLPSSIHYLSDVSKSSSSSSPQKKEDTPLFWHIPRSGGTMVKDILTQCRSAVLASDAGRWSEEGTAEELKQVSINGDKYLNVDMSTTAGIDRAKSLGVASSGMADAIITPYILKSTSLFDDNHHGLAFTMMRHPVERAASMYNYLKKNGNAEIKRLSIEEYAKSPHAENNWMVRFLTGKLGGEVTDDDLLVAKEVLRTKFVVGLLEQKNSSMKRFEQYFGWTYMENPKEQYSCRKKAIEKTDKGVKKGDGDGSTKIKEGTQAYSLLLWQNNLDMKLYLYAQHVFNLQGKELFPNLETNQ